MSYGNDPMGAALDRYITGNYGEDQFIDQCDGVGCVRVEECSECKGSGTDEEQGCDCPTCGGYGAVCPFKYDRAACRENERIEAAEARWEMEDGR